MTPSVADLHSKNLDAPPCPNSFNFMQFFGKIWQNRKLDVLIFKLFGVVMIQRELTATSWKEIEEGRSSHTHMECIFSSFFLK